MNREDIMRDFVRRVEVTRKPVDIVLYNGQILRNIGSVEYHPKNTDKVMLYPIWSNWDERDRIIVRCDKIKEIR
jgi:hypothetical protein